MFGFTVIYDNIASQDFAGSWGFSVLVETDAKPFFSIFLKFFRQIPE